MGFDNSILLIWLFQLSYKFSLKKRQSEIKFRLLLVMWLPSIGVEHKLRYELGFHVKKYSIKPNSSNTLKVCLRDQIFQYNPTWLSIKGNKFSLQGVVSRTEQSNENRYMLQYKFLLLSAFDFWNIWAKSRKPIAA